MILQISFSRMMIKVIAMIRKTFWFCEKVFDSSFQQHFLTSSVMHVCHHIHIHTQHTHTQTHTQVYINIYIHTNTHTQTHTHTHTHTTTHKHESRASVKLICMWSYFSRSASIISIFYIPLILIFLSLITFIPILIHFLQM